LLIGILSGVSGEAGCLQCLFVGEDLLIRIYNIPDTVY